ncbi:hypothetical protein M231_05167 [Tremella mesenterica]|uniref:Uncharacterized protein n=1 Tax=Tremella mesenterica TaxID=5217 RepID=A0A4Q1BIX6_TREME|nr:uncharacterized protein TREMEDRAFT_24317 [Tremella mesenterica DSM 1558]EIW72606.1 hypothetical protein TREMEDRAFT_24317 [Tremella mesenterica DSM 1558]RXK37542.1 hypothetical protein M231_05167 [Tremella mesenterica]
MSKINNLPSQVDILRSNKAAKKGPGASGINDTITVWPKPEFGPGTTIDNITKEGKTADEFILPAGSMFPLGCAIPAHTVLRYGMYFPPGTMFPDGVLVPIHARFVSVQPIETDKEGAPTIEPQCVIQ